MLVDNVLESALSGGSPADHVFERKRYDPSDTNDILVSTEGVYTFTIQATSVAAGAAAAVSVALQVAPASGER
jgi:hypothetical protein